MRAAVAGGALPRAVVLGISVITGVLLATAFAATGVVLTSAVGEPPPGAVVVVQLHVGASGVALAAAIVGPFPGVATLGIFVIAGICGLL